MKKREPDLEHIFERLGVVEQGKAAQERNGMNETTTTSEADVFPPDRPRPELRVATEHGQPVADALTQTSKGVQAFLDSMRHPGEDDPLDGPQEIIPGIISEGQTGLFPGPPGSGKSFVIIDWLARVAKGLDFLDQPVMHGGVVYVTGEGQGGLAKRISALITELELEATAPFIYMHRMPHLLDPQQVSDFIAALKLRTAKWTVPVRLIAMDTLNRALVGGSEIDGKDIGKLLDADSQIKRAFNCATGGWGRCRSPRRLSQWLPREKVVD